MNFIWNMDGIRIMSISTNRWEGAQMWTSGYAQLRDNICQWEATALPGGWYIVITRPSGKMGEVQGATFNLPLEIASAVRRFV